MGSEHYCLRWNNHQSNLLGVFSQLLQNESLVDVTLACSEGAPIRAHKVVLSACSSYFQSLFLDHPERHPIVILKDVRFSELQTLVEFMYKGEVNVQYCQLSALLKTAESLKVKGLAEMTNQNTASREPEREPERLRPHSQPKTCDSPMDGVSSGNNNGNQAQNLNTIASHLNSSSSSSASTVHLKREDRGGGGSGGGGGSSPTSSLLLPITKSSPVSLDYYQRNCPSGSSPRRSPTNNNDGEPQIRHHLTSPDHDRPNSAQDGGGGSGGNVLSGSCDDNLQSQDCGINMSMSGGSGGSGNSGSSTATSATQSNTSISLSVVVPSINSSSSSTIPSDLSNRPSSRSGHDRSNNNGGPSSTITHSSSSGGGGGLGSPNMKCEPVAGPSGLGPVQSVPLSLKKEIDWDRNDEKSSSDTMDFRHSHDSAEDPNFLPNFVRTLAAAQHNIAGTSASAPATRCPTPFAFPFTPLGLSLFDTDPSRILSMLHHQTLLAEEALRYRGIFFTPNKDHLFSRYNTISDILSKDHQDFLTKRAQLLFKQQIPTTVNYPPPQGSATSTKHHYQQPTPPPSTASSLSSLSSAISTSSTSSTSSRYRQDSPATTVQIHLNNNNIKDPLIEELKRKSEETVQDEQEIEMQQENGRPNSKESLHEYLRRRSTASVASSTSASVSASIPLSASGLPSAPGCLNIFSEKEKSSSSSTSSSPQPQLQPNSMLLQPPQLKPTLGDSLIFTEQMEEDTRCIICNANFPNVWLLEQHVALQHANMGPAYAKHKEQQANHRARLPADKLFTCDVCGMQFRYLKSFKKHRLNHALERLHGKKDKKPDGQDVVTSSNEMNNEEGTDLRINIKRERDEEEQDSTVDSAGLMFSEQHNTSLEPNISSSENILNSTNKRPRLISPMNTEPAHLLHQTQPSPQTHLTMNALTSPTTTINSLINAERIPNEQFLGLNPQEASILNFLRVDAAERQNRDNKRPQSSRFACPFCGKCVRSKENLKLHVRKHTGERPFVCLFCGRAFGGKSDLTRHLRIHTGERPYHCESCGKCFARADYLSKHLTTHIHNAPR